MWAHSPAGEGVGESQFRREERHCSTHVLCGYNPSYCSQPQSQLENSFVLLANETLESLGDKFNELIEENSQLAQGDVTLGK
jgi:hypothetical protein